MADFAITLVQARRRNIERYSRLLQTSLTDVERAYIERRLVEERAALRSVDLPYTNAATSSQRSEC